MATSIKDLLASAEGFRSTAIANQKRANDRNEHALVIACMAERDVYDHFLERFAHGATTEAFAAYRAEMPGRVVHARQNERSYSVGSAGDRGWAIYYGAIADSLAMLAAWLDAQGGQ